MEKRIKETMEVIKELEKGIKKEEQGRRWRKERRQEEEEEIDR